MNAQALRKDSEQRMTKLDPSQPALGLIDGELTIAAGTIFDGYTFVDAMPVPCGTMVPGHDYVVVMRDGIPSIRLLDTADIPADVLGGFHYAPGGNAGARAGGDETPAINPFSLWDLNFRPDCADPRGMALVDGRFWADIYLLGVDHLKNGTSRCGFTIADGDDLPGDPTGEGFKRFNYETACAVMAHHGKGLLGAEEFFAAALGVSESSAAEDEPEITGVDAARTSRWGLMQATGNMWVWGHDGDPDTPRASFFGGSWLNDGHAGSRFAHLGAWPEYSNDDLGARGRSDHLQLG